MKPILKLWETDTRYYTAELMENLFGEWTIYRNWGSKHSRRRGGKPVFCSSYNEGLLELERLAKLRKRHKYKIINHREKE